MKRIVTLFFVLLSLFCSGCGDQQESVKATVATETVTEKPVETVTPTTLPSDHITHPISVLLEEPAELARYETPPQALQKWYDLRGLHPALLLYSQNPLLQHTNSKIRDTLATVLTNKDDDSLLFDIANPAILPAFTVDAALESSFFSAFYWVFPSSEEMDALSVETFRKQMIQSGNLSEEEAQSLTLRNGVFSGKVRGLPFYAAHPKADFKIDGPVVFHLDLSYFSPLYQGEFKTPLFPLVYETLKRLQNKQLSTVTTGFSYSQTSQQVPLGSRFLGDVFHLLFEQPQQLDENLPANWQQRANALYLPNMMIIEEARKILLQLAERQPDDPSLHYALYQVSRESKSTYPVALRHLADAVQRDPVYAYEYLRLAPQARENNRPDEALRMLRLAHEANPESPMMTLSLAEALLADGQTDSAASLLKQLQALNWSSIYYSDMPDYLAQLLTDASK